MVKVWLINLVGVWRGMARVKSEKIKGFVLSFEDDNGYIVDLRFVSSHHCEMVLRGLVHSGFKVTSSEEIFDIPGRAKATYQFDEYGSGGDFCEHVPGSIQTATHL